MHSKGGLSTIENGALFHKDCHPRSEKAVKDFAEVWKGKLEKQAAENTANASAFIGATPATASLVVKSGKRGRRKMTPEEKMTRLFEKIGMSHDDAVRAAKDAAQAATDLANGQ